MENVCKKITVRAVRSDDYKIIFDLCEERFGKGYLTRREFDEWLSYPELFLAAECNGDFAGFVFHMPESVDTLAEFLKLSRDYIKAVSKGKPVLHCKTAVLVPRHEGSGVMQTLVGTVDESSKRLGYGAAFAPAWKYNGTVPMQRVLERCGYEKIAEKENIWYSLENYTCVVCGGRCKCSAAIFQKTF